MNKTAIKNFAIWARNKLIADIVYQAGLLGVTEKGIAQPLPQSTNEVQFFDIGTKDYMTVRGKAIRQRNAFVAAIKAKQADTDYASAFRFVVEKVAYTWFNRLIAIRFMEVNDYLPGRVRVLSSENPGKAEPDMVTRPFDTDLSFSAQEQDEIMRMKDENKLDELFRMLFIKQCQKLHEVLPGLFDPQGIERVDSYLELLLTISFTDKDGVLWHLVHDISEDDFNVEKEGQVEIIGWMYQYYNTEQNELVYDGRFSKDKIPKELLPAATTIYTPDWAVKYMVQNSLGRLWTDSHPDFDVKKWKYYLPEAEQTSNVKAELEIRNSERIDITQIRCIDICMGSGHILVHLMETLMDIYVSQGWTEREAIQSIVKNNIFGLDLDDRAAQFAYFAVMIKARQYDRRFLERGIRPNVFSIKESNSVERKHIDSLGINMCENDRKVASKQLNMLLDSFLDAKEYGSILNIPDLDYVFLDKYLKDVDVRTQVDFESIGIEKTKELLEQLIKQAEIFNQKYDVVITNPPYLGSSRFSPKLEKYIKKNEPDVKSDLSMVMYKRAIDSFCKEYGFVSFITTTSWMFISSFEKLRSYAAANTAYYSLVDFGTELFDGKVGHNPIVAWVSRRSITSEYTMQAVRLVDYCYARRDEKEPEFFEPRNYYQAKQSQFNKIPGKPIAYWVGDALYRSFELGKTIGELYDCKIGIQTGNNDLFCRLWPEVDINTIYGISEKGLRWYPYTKGGYYRKWYGNNDLLINWENSGEKIKEYNSFSTVNQSFWFKKCITWGLVSSGRSNFRYINDSIHIIGNGGPMCNAGDENLTILALLNSNVGEYFLKLLNPTINMSTGTVSSIPVLRLSSKVEEIERLTKSCISICQQDWDSFETSWDYKRHPLINNTTTGRKSLLLSQCWKNWQLSCEDRFNLLKKNEEELNRIFIEIYGLSKEVKPEVDNKDVTVSYAELGREIRSLVSYAVGCMFGRYSLDVDGISFAGGVWDMTKYKTILPDQDNCIPITDDTYFEDDIVGRFVSFIRTVYGEETLEENLDFIAKAIGNKGNTSREVIRNYFLNDFIKDHIKTYQKRPIYWLFDSGKQNGFKALVYMHRWNADTVGNLRVEYLHRMQRVYEKEIERMQDIIDNSRDNREVNLASKRREKLVKQLKEARDYDAKIAHVALSRVEIDLDDGVKVNYEKVQKGPDGKSLGILAKI